MKLLVRLHFLPLVALLTSACTPSSQPPGKAQASGKYNQFDAWRTSNRITPYAAAGSAQALHDLFLATYTRASDPYQGGEDLEQMCSNLADVATAIGDANFAAALKLERPEIVNAVRLIGSGCLKSYPITNSVIRSAPVMILPLESSMNNVSTPLMKTLLKEEG